MKQTLLLSLCAGALLAQAPPTVVEREIRIMGPGAGGPGMGAMTFMRAEAGFEASLVKGAPFAGDFVTENTQALADGNRIRTSNSTSYARDAEGRTRREVSMDVFGTLAGGASRKTVFIHDPVAKVDYVLDPHAKTARKINVGAMTTVADGNGPTRNFVVRRSAPDSNGVVSAEPVTRPLPPGMAVNGEQNTFIFRRMEAGPGASVSTNSANVKNEPLGKRNFDGIEAEGTRTTVTVPAGQIGNDAPLTTVSERWYSNELKTVVMTSRKDPRTGESVYKLTNLRRGEPARNLFEVPADYKVIEGPEGGNVIRMQVNDKE